MSVALTCLIRIVSADKSWEFDLFLTTNEILVNQVEERVPTSYSHKK